jgi:hypothetical protein
MEKPNVHGEVRERHTAVAQVVIDGKLALAEAAVERAKQMSLDIHLPERRGLLTLRFSELGAARSVRKITHLGSNQKINDGNDGAAAGLLRQWVEKKGGAQGGANAVLHNARNHLHEPLVVSYAAVQL